MSTDTPIQVYYQTGCPFCEWCRKFVERRDKCKRITFSDIETYDGVSRLRNDKGEPTTIVVVKEGRHFIKYLACMVIGRSFGGVWSLLASIGFLVPVSIGDRVYDWVSRHRPLLMRLVKFFR